jgi:beta-glucosidase
VNAGIDIFMAPTDWRNLRRNIIKDVKDGDVPMARIDDAVRRILRVKLRAGLFDDGKPSEQPLAGRADLIGAQAHRDLAREAVRQSLVLLRNEGDLLPLSPDAHVLVAGDGADNIPKQTGGWSLTWQNRENDNDDFPGATSIYGGIRAAVEAAGGSTELNAEGEFERRPDVAIVVFGENPYTEFEGDLPDLDYLTRSPQDLELMRSLKQQGIPVVAVFLTGRPLWVDAALEASDAFVVAWLPGSEGQGVADVLFRAPDGSVPHNFSGRLSFSWPASADQALVNRHDPEYEPRFPYGYGLSY